MIAKAILLGRIGFKKTGSTREGVPIVTLSIATNKVYKTTKGEKKESTSWHTVNCFSKLADIAGKYANVGNLIYIEGNINSQKTEKEGAEKWVYSVTASEIKLLPNAKQENYGNNEEYFKSNDYLND